MFSFTRAMAEPWSSFAELVGCSHRVAQKQGILLLHTLEEVHSPEAAHPGVAARRSMAALHRAEALLLRSLGEEPRNSEEQLDSAQEEQLDSSEEVRRNSEEEPHSSEEVHHAEGSPCRWGLELGEVDLPDALPMVLR